MTDQPTPRHPLQVLRESLGVTRTDLADSIDRTRTFISMVESGRTHLGRESVLALFERYRGDLNRLGITAEDLLRGCRGDLTTDLGAQVDAR